MNKNMNKIMSLLMLFLGMIIMFSPIISFAEQGQPAQQTESKPSYTTKTIGSTATKINEKDYDSSFEKNESNLPNVTIDQASAWADKKGFEVVKFLQVVIKPLATIAFIGCAILVLFGSFGNGTGVGKGIAGMIISLVVYIVVLYAPELMAFFLNWVRT